MALYILRPGLKSERIENNYTGCQQLLYLSTRSPCSCEQHYIQDFLQNIRGSLKKNQSAAVDHRQLERKIHRPSPVRFMQILI